MNARYFMPAIFAVAVGCAPATPTGPTYYKDIKPLVEQHCANCHSQGGIAPFTLENYLSALDHKMEIRKALSEKTMPPWQPGAGCTDYQGDFSLDDATIKTFTDWVDTGANAGNEADYKPTATLVPAGLTRIDRSVQLSVPYTPVRSPDDYHCFLMDWPEAATSYVTGFRATPGDKRIVHHVIAFLAPPAQVAAYQALDDAEAGPGYTCFGGPGNGGSLAQWLGAWAPGTAGGDFPAGTGIEVEAGSKIILQVHYNTSVQPPVPDQTSIDFKIDSTVEKKAILQPWTNPSWINQKTMTIPAGMPNVMHNWIVDPMLPLAYVTKGLVAVDQSFTMHTSGLHMHTRGTSARLDILRADGTKECLLDLPRWDFHWQGGYAFTNAKTFNPGDMLSLECHWDNSKGTTDVNWGEGTGDEMCLGSFYITH